jgi:hypothetical protein
MRYWILILCALFLMGLDWDGGGAGYEDTPGPNDQLSEADDRMREMKDQNRKRLQAEHHIGSGFGIGTDDNGLHQVGSGRCFFQSAAPTALLNSSGDYDAPGDIALAVTDLNDSASNSGGAIADDVGHARCWVDSDDLKLYIYVGVAGNNNGAWVPVAGGGEGKFSAVYNGSFQAMGGTGLTSTDPPDGWTVSPAETPLIAYFNSSDAIFGAGTMITVANSGAADEGIRYEMDGLHASSTYIVVVRALDDGTANCTAAVTGNGGTAFAALPGGIIATTGSATWVTLLGSFVTGAAIDDDVILDLETNGIAGLGCSYSNASVYKVNGSGVSLGGVTLVTETAATGAAIGAAYADVSAGFDVRVRAPMPGCMVEVFSEIPVLVTDAGVVTCSIEEDDGSAASVGESVLGPFLVVPASDVLFDTALSIWMRGNLPPNTNITYTPQCKVTNAAGTYSCNAGIDCRIWAKMTCGMN